MPTEHEWPEEDPASVEEALKRLDRLNHGLEKDLWTMHKRCHREVEHGNSDHLPMCYVRNEKSGELYYICRKCISEYLMKHPINRESVEVLRGKLTEEAEMFFREWARFSYEKEAAKRKKEEERLQRFFKSNKPCPVCGKPAKEHKDEDWQKCFKDQSQANPDPEPNNP